MRLKVLGSASSQGIPQPFCTCLTCAKASGRNQRLRSSYLVELISGTSILLDACPDWRQQHLASRFEFDYLFLSHRHRDHISGLGEIRTALEAHDKKRTQFQKQRAFLLGSTLNRWLTDKQRDSRWEESVQQAYQQLLSRKFFRQTVLIPFKKVALNRNLTITYIRGRHGNNYCGGLVIKEDNNSLVYLADISNFNDKLKSYLSKINPDLVIAHVPFFYSPREKIEKERHAGVEKAKKLPGKKVLLSHFSHRVKLKHKELVEEAKKIDKRLVIAYDNQEIVI